MHGNLGREWNRFTVGLSAQHIGSDLPFGDATVALPRRMTLGAALPTELHYQPVEFAVRVHGAQLDIVVQFGAGHAVHPKGVGCGGQRDARGEFRRRRVHRS